MWDLVLVAKIKETVLLDPALTEQSVITLCQKRHRAPRVRGRGGVSQNKQAPWPSTCWMDSSGDDDDDD